ncbi:putative inorganic phosphate cotransporter isoform X2 [Trichogramma pretiosum]|uniref:putative inorganic phosphate cotransporter isoform X2 n=1 Tax=Trichogramma pretiosum TaxID=7493 RepID=UPI0006C9ADA3|nr:putative inorganic phosphate cotransporter isoform X2 [Trichogramma pretiosum]
MTRQGSLRRVSLADNMKEAPVKPKDKIGARHVQALLLTGGFLCCYAMRVCMSVAVVAMSDKTKPMHFDWDESTQNLMLSSFFWGYVLTQIPGGMVAQRWGAQRLYGAAVGLCGLATLAIPIAARYGDYQLVCACRVFCGLCQGVVPPIIHTLLAKWVPLPERGRFTSFVYSGGWVGNVIALQSSGLLAGSLLGWSSCFYFWGSLSLGWAVLWQFAGRESPAEHTEMAFDERLYIESSLGVVETTAPVTTPWRAILTSVPVWALLVTQCSQSWGFWMLLSKIPSYMDKVLHYDIQNNGLISSLPYLCAWLMSFPVSIMSDWAIRKNRLSTRSSRMICNTFGEVFPALALVGLGFVGAGQQLLAVGILVLAVTGNIAIYCGHHANHMDLSPNYAGPLMGFTNAAANVCSILAPLVQGYVVKDPSNVAEWRSIFFLTAGIYAAGATTFLCFGSVQVQSWNDATIKRSCSARRSTLSARRPVPPIPITEIYSSEQTKANVIGSNVAVIEEKIER